MGPVATPQYVPLAEVRIFVALAGRRVDDTLGAFQANVHVWRCQNQRRRAHVERPDGSRLPLCDTVYSNPFGLVRTPAAASDPADIRRSNTGHRNTWCISAHQPFALTQMCQQNT